MLEMLLWLSVRAAPAAHGPDVQRNVSKAPSWPGSWVAGSRHNGHSTADTCLPFPIWPPPECTSLCGRLQKPALLHGGWAMWLSGSAEKGLSGPLRSWGPVPAPPIPAEIALPAQWWARLGVSHLPLGLP